MDQIVFAQPALLAGIGAAGVPILLHLLLRPRPRRTRFPAIALLRRVVVSGQRANLLRNVILMLVRALLLGVAAVLLAGPTYTRRAGEFIGTEPAACVIVLDDSASMYYRVDRNTTRLDMMRAAAAEFAEQSAGWPEQALLSVLHAQVEGAPLPLTTDRAAAIEALHTPGGGAEHGETLSGALGTAAELLRGADQRVKRIVVFTDGAAHAWRDVTPALLAGLEDLALRVVTPSEQQQSNLGVVGADGPVRVHPATAPVPIRTTLAAVGLGSECWLLVREGERVLQRVGPLQVSSGRAREVAVEVPAMKPGAHAVALEIEPADRMDFDQRRYVVFETARPPVVWLVTGAGRSAEDDLTAVILRNLLAPEVLAAEQQLVELEVLSPDRLAEWFDGGGFAQRRQPTLAVILANEGLGPAGLAGLLRAVESGMGILLVPGSPDQDVDWPGLRPLLSATVGGVETLEAVSTIRWEPASEYAAVGELAELTRCGVRRRVLLGELPDEAVVHARYADGVPAIVSTGRGAGRVMLLTTSPDPEWSDLGIRASGLITWLHRLVDERRGPAEAVAGFTLGEQTRHSFASLPPAGLVRVRFAAEADGRPTWMRLSSGEPKEPWPTDRAGVYMLDAPGSGGPAAMYAVNWPAEESELEPVALGALQRLLGVEDMGIDTPEAEREGRGATVVERILGGRGVRRALGGVLLALFLLELGVAARRRQVVAE